MATKPRTETGQPAKTRIKTHPTEVEAASAPPSDPEPESPVANQAKLVDCNRQLQESFKARARQRAAKLKALEELTK